MDKIKTVKNKDIKASMYADFRDFLLLKRTPKKIRKHISIDAFMLREWIESKFTKDMSWENYGSYWVVDHIVPMRFFNLLDENDLSLCWNYKNLMPLLRSDNEKKNGNIYFSLFLLKAVKGKDYYYNMMYDILMSEYNDMQKYIDVYATNRNFKI
jgi:hypothetical protein